MPIIPYAKTRKILAESMPRPVKWARDLHAIRERAANSTVEAWSRVDIEKLFGVGRATAQTLTRAIGEVNPVAGAHFVDRSSLLAFLDEMIAAPSVEDGLRTRLTQAPSPPRRRPLKVALPRDLQAKLARDLPDHIRISTGMLTIHASEMDLLLGSLVLLAKTLECDYEGVQERLAPPRAPADDDALRSLVERLRS